ncbi:MAG: Stage sporulation family protein, partial [Planctomycetaceae bacterium]|nr:Stage sporulation family protein [Planctomycetaceae bacterium]
MAVLTMLEGEEKGRSWDLKPEMLIGREPVQCDIVLSGRSVSRFHAHLFENHGTYFIEDARSRNKTYVNGEILERKRELRDRDVIRICGDSFLFQMVPFPPPSSALDGTKSDFLSEQSSDSGFDSQNSHAPDGLPHIVSVPSSRDRRIPAIADGPDLVDQSAILSS